MKKSTTKIELPCLTYGKQLADDEFINLFEECIKYASISGALSVTRIGSRYSIPELEEVLNYDKSI